MDMRLYPEGGLMSKSLAIVVMGGLIPSTLHILIVVSIIFELIEVWLREERKPERHPIRLTL